jgi:hypothetical protein
MGVPFNKEGKGPYIVKECVVVSGGGLIHFFAGDERHSSSVLLHYQEMMKMMMRKDLRSTNDNARTDLWTK